MKEDEEDAESDEEWPWISFCPGVHLRWNFFCFCTAYSEEGEKSTEAFVKKPCESDFDEIFGLNSIVFLW